MLDGGEHHAIAIDVESEWRFADCDVIQVVSGAFLADEFPFALRLELQRCGLGYGELRGCGDETAEVEPSIRRAMHDLVILRKAFRHRNAPLRCRGADEHCPRAGAGPPECIIEIADGA